MSSLPGASIVLRELRVTARSRRFFRIKLLAGLAAAVVGLLSLAAGTGNRAGGGQAAFYSLTALMALTALLCGPFLTADSISREKREGTLGLLFLSGLKPIEILLGKFFASLVRSFAALLAMIPLVALAFLSGGVTLPELIRVCGALLAILLLSLAAGLFASTCGHSGGNSAGLAGFLLALLNLVLPVVDVLRGTFNLGPSPDTPFFALASAAQLFVSIGTPVGFGGTGNPYVLGLVVHLALTLVFMFFAARVLPRVSLTEQRPRRASRWREKLRRFNGRTPGLLERNPVAWLAGVPRWQGLVASGIVALTAVFTLTPHSVGTVWNFNPLLVYFIPYGLNLMVARQATLLFAEGRRDGGLELLLCTPLERKCFIDGQLLAIRRGMMLPYLLCIGVLWGNLLISLWFLRDRPGARDDEVIAMALLLYATVRILVGAKAVAVTGVYFGLTSRNPDSALLKTALLTVGLPLLLFCLPDLLFYLVALIVFSNGLNRGIDRLLEKQFARQPRRD